MNRTLCLLYHDIVPDEQSETSGFRGPSVRRYKLPPARFENHVRRIARRDVPVRTVDECPPGEADGGIYLTFDDGGESLYTYAAPILEEYGMQGHVSIVTERIGRSGFLDADQIRTLSENGHHIMSHTVTHPDLIACDPGDRAAELEQSKATLENITDRDCTTLSIPGGRYDETVLRAARDAGYEFVFTSDPIVNPEGETLGRWNIWNTTTADELESILHQEFITVKKIQLRWETLQVIKSVVGKKRFVRIRDWIWG